MTFMARTLRTQIAISVVVPSGTILSQSAPLRTAGTTKTGTISMPGLKSGSGVLVCVSNYLGEMTSVVGSLNGAYTRAFGFSDGGDNTMEYFIKLNSAAGNDTITLTSSGAAADTYLSASAIEIAGLGALDKTGGTYNGLTATATAANAQAKEFVVTGASWDSGGSADFTTPAGYTLIDRENQADGYSAMQYAFKVTTAIETSTATIGASDPKNPDVSIATFLLSP